MARLTLNPGANAPISRSAFDLTGNARFLSAEQIFTTRFDDLNNTGVSGYAIVGFDEQTNRLFVSIRADGLESGQMHVQHIHGFMPDDDGVVMDSVSPTMADDEDGDGFVELAEAADKYGPILLTLGETGNSDGFEGDAMFQTVGADGMLSYNGVFKLPDQDLGADPMLALREIVIHGVTLDEGEGDNGGEADGTAGYKAVLPVAVGELERALSAQDVIDAGMDMGGDDEPSQLAYLAANVTGNDAYLDADEFYFTGFEDLNGSGVSGVAILGFDDDTDTLTVTIKARGLEPDQDHIQHIHGFMAGDGGTVQESMVPTMALDADGDGFIELSEAGSAYGPILLTLADATDGMGDGETFPDIDDDGILTFTETYSLPQQDLGADPMLALREIVIHGMTLDEGEGANGGEADGTAGYKAVLPVAAGNIEHVDNVGELGVMLAIYSLSDFNPASGQGAAIYDQTISFG